MELRSTEVRRVLLVVDDEASVLRFVQRVFSRDHRYQILTACDVTTAIELIETQNPDVVLLDIHMRGQQMNGVDCIRVAREKRYQGIICMLTGDPSSELLFESAMAGADEYIVKGPGCSLVEEVEYLFEHKDTHAASTSAITDGSYLRSRGLLEEQCALLADFAKHGYPRLKEFSNRLGISETSLWKRLSRIRNKLDVDSMSQVAHLVTVVSMFERHDKGKPPDKE